MFCLESCRIQFRLMFWISVSTYITSCLEVKYERKIKYNVYIRPHIVSFIVIISKTTANVFHLKKVFYLLKSINISHQKASTFRRWTKYFFSFSVHQRKKDSIYNSLKELLTEKTMSLVGVWSSSRFINFHSIFIHQTTLKVL